MISDKWIMAVDKAAIGGDRSCRTIFRTPGVIRKLLRKIHLDKSNWEYRVVRMEYWDEE